MRTEHTRRAKGKNESQQQKIFQDWENWEIKIVRTHCNDLMRTLRIEDIISLAEYVYIYLDRIYFSRVSAISRRDIVQV